MEDAFPETELHVVRSSRLRTALLAAAMLGVGVDLVGAVLDWFDAPPAFLLPLAFAAAAALVGAARRAQLDLVRVRADARGLALGDRLIPREALREGFVVPQAVGPPCVVLRRRLRPVVQIRVSDAVEGRRLLRALGLDVTQAAARFWAIPRGRAGVGSLALTIGLLVLSIVALAGDWAPPLVAWVVPKLGALGILGAFAALLVPTRLIVGAEGVTVRWLGLRRFFRHDDVRRVEIVSGVGGSSAVGVRVLLRAGGSLVVPLGTGAGDLERAAILAERIREAALVYRERAPDDDASALGRGGRASREWLTRLRALGAGANAAFREAPLPRERLFDLAENPRADMRTRAAAAVALGGAMDDAARARVRAAATATAIPALRVVLERAAAGAPDEAIEEALAAVEAAAERRG